MQNSQLLSLLASLSKKELRECKKWLLSPMHNQREDVYLLFEYLTSGNRLEDDLLVDKKKIFRKIFPREAFDDARLRQTIHFLQSSLEEYLFFQKANADDQFKLLTLAEEYRERKLDKLYDRNMRKLEASTESTAILDDRHLDKRYLIEMEKYAKIGETRAVETNLEAVSDALETAFIARKLKLTGLMLSHQRIYKTAYQTGSLEWVLQYIELNPNLLENPLVSIYYYLFHIFQDPDQEHYFYDLKGTIRKVAHQLQLRERSDIYLMAINYCIARMNTGSQPFVREAFDIYKTALEDGALIENNEIGHLTFRNIVSIGTSLKEFDWVDNFITAYQKYLPDEFRDNFVQFSLAKLHFEKGDYNQAQRLLIQFDIDDILINLSAKSMLIRIYYEEGEFNALESLLDSLRAYINRKKMIAYHKNIYNNLIRYTKKLIRVTPYNKEQKARLRQEIESTNPLPERKWLLEQLEAL